MKKIALLVSLIVVLLVVTFVINSNINKTQEPKANNSSQEELTETFKGKFVSFKYPKNFHVNEEAGFVKLYDDNFNKPLLVLSESSYGNEKNISIDEWYYGEPSNFERGAPSIRDDLSYKFTVGGRYDAFYVVYDPIMSSDETKDYFVNNVEIYINNNSRIFNIYTEKINPSKNILFLDQMITNPYSLEEIAQAKQYEKIVDEIIQSIHFVE